MFRSGDPTKHERLVSFAMNLVGYVCPCLLFPIADAACGYRTDIDINKHVPPAPLNFHLIPDYTKTLLHRFVCLHTKFCPLLSKT